MGIHSRTGHDGGAEGLPLYRNSSPQSDSVLTTKREVERVFKNCRMCGVVCKGILCDSCERDVQRGGYTDYFRGQSPSKKVLLDIPFLLEEQKYHQSHSILGREVIEEGDVYVLGIEMYDDFLVCIISISREVPWVHKGRKLGPDGKRDGEETLTQKTSYREEKYRVACDPKNLVVKEMVVYNGSQKNGKLVPDTEINYSSLLKIVGSIIKVLKHNLAQLNNGIQ